MKSVVFAVYLDCWWADFGTVTLGVVGLLQNERTLCFSVARDE